MPKYPDIEVQLVGNSGNALAILGTITREMRRHGVSGGDIDQFVNEATSGDYDHLLQTAMEWVEVN